jgi:hypothetical protein
MHVTETLPKAFSIRFSTDNEGSVLPAPRGKATFQVQYQLEKAAAHGDRDNDSVQILLA